MLVLSRKSDESVIVGATDFGSLLRVCVLEVRDGRVKLGFEANERFVVHREEVWERIRANGLDGRSSIGSAPLKQELERLLNDGGGLEHPKRRSNGHLAG